MCEVIALGRFMTREQVAYANLRASKPSHQDLARLIKQCEINIRGRVNVEDAIACIHAIEIYCEDTSQGDDASHVVAIYLSMQS